MGKGGISEIHLPAGLKKKAVPILCHKEVNSPGDPMQPRQEAWAPDKNISLF